MLSLHIGCVLTFFAVCGFGSRGLTERKLSHISFMVHIFLVSFLTVYLFRGELSMDKNQTKLQKINGMGQFLCGLISNWVFILEPYMKRKKQKDFWYICQRIKHSYAKDVVNLQGYTLKFFEYTTFYTLVTLVLIRQIISDGIFFSMTLISIVCQVRVFHCLFYMEFIRFELKIIENKAKYLYIANKTDPSRELLNENTKTKQMQFKSIREYYELVMEMKNYFNSCYGCSNLATVINSFILLLTDLNWMLLDHCEGHFNCYLGTHNYDYLISYYQN